MSVELTMLIYSAGLYALIILVQATLAIKQNGLMAQAGPRDNLPEPTLLRLRLLRLQGNMQENLVLFAIVVLAAQAVGALNGTTALCATLFFYARLAHALVYGFGWPAVRPLFWFVGWLCTVVIGVQALVA